MTNLHTALFVTSLCLAGCGGSAPAPAEAPSARSEVASPTPEASEELTLLGSWVPDPECIPEMRGMEGADAAQIERVASQLARNRYVYDDETFAHHNPAFPRPVVQPYRVLSHVGRSWTYEIAGPDGRPFVIEASLEPTGRLRLQRNGGLELCLLPGTEIDAPATEAPPPAPVAPPPPPPSARRDEEPREGEVALDARSIRYGDVTFTVGMRVRITSRAGNRIRPENSGHPRSVGYGPGQVGTIVRFAHSETEVAGYRYSNDLAYVRWDAQVWYEWELPIDRMTPGVAYDSDDIARMNAEVGPPVELPVMTLRSGLYNLEPVP